jgi:hypothetical protein
VPPTDPRSIALVLLWLVICFAAGWSAPFLGFAAAGGRATVAPDAHWTERARLRGPAATALTFALLVSPVIAGVAGGEVSHEVAGMPPRLGGVLSGVAALCGVAVASARVTRRDREPPLGVSGLVSDWLVMALLFWVGYAVVVAAAVAMPLTWGAEPLLVLIGALTLLIVLAGGGISVCLLALGLARRAPEELDARVRAAAARAGVVVRRVLVVETSMANAAVLPLPRDVLLFRPILDFPAEELDAVLAHEVGHLCESRTVAWARLLPAFALLPSAALGPLWNGFGLPTALTIVLLPLFAALFAGRFVRALEARADAHAHAHEHEDPAREGVYARALARLAERNLTPAVRGGKGAHPDLWDRMVAAGVEPDFPRPAPPSRLRQRSGVFTAVTVCCVVLVVGSFVVLLLAALSR